MLGLLDWERLREMGWLWSWRCTRLSPLGTDAKMALYTRCARDLLGGTRVRERGKEEELLRKSLRLQQSYKKAWAGLSIPMLSHWLGATSGKCGLSRNRGVDSESSS